MTDDKAFELFLELLADIVLKQCMKHKKEAA